MCIAVRATMMLQVEFGLGYTLHLIFRSCQLARVKVSDAESQSPRWQIDFWKYLLLQLSCFCGISGKARVFSSKLSEVSLCLLPFLPCLLLLPIIIFKGCFTLKLAFMQLWHLIFPPPRLSMQCKTDRCERGKLNSVSKSHGNAQAGHETFEAQVIPRCGRCLLWPSGLWGCGIDHDHIEAWLNIGLDILSSASQVFICDTCSSFEINRLEYRVQQR